MDSQMERKLNAMALAIAGDLKIDPQYLNQDIETLVNSAILEKRAGLMEEEITKLNINNFNMEYINLCNKYLVNELVNKNRFWEILDNVIEENGEEIFYNVLINLSIACITKPESKRDAYFAYGAIVKNIKNVISAYRTASSKYEEQLKYVDSKEKADRILYKFNLQGENNPFLYKDINNEPLTVDKLIRHNCSDFCYTYTVEESVFKKSTKVVRYNPNIAILARLMAGYRYYKKLKEKLDFFKELEGDK